MDVPTGTDGVVPFERHRPRGAARRRLARRVGAALLRRRAVRAGQGRPRGRAGGTYGGGRYLLDTSKGAHLGAADDGLVVDLNFAYNPSCAYDPAWACPLAQAENTVPVGLDVGERARVRTHERDHLDVGVGQPRSARRSTRAVGATRPPTPDALVAFARERGLTRVMLAAPWAADEGPVGDWFTAAVARTHGRPGSRWPRWVATPGGSGTPRLAVQWSRAARAAGATAIQLDVEPWALPAWQSRPGRARCGGGSRCSTPCALDLARARAGHRLPVVARLHEPTATAPCWTPSCRARTASASSRSPTTPPGRTASSPWPRPPRSRAGCRSRSGSRRTPRRSPAERSSRSTTRAPHALEREAALVRDAFADVPGYEGVSVEHHRAWRSLLDASAGRTGRSTACAPAISSTTTVVPHTRHGRPARP